MARSQAEQEARTLRVALVWNGTVHQEETLSTPMPVVLDGTHIEPRKSGGSKRFIVAAVWFAVAAAALAVGRFLTLPVYADLALGAAGIVAIVLGIASAVSPRREREVVFAMPGDLGESDLITLIEPSKTGLRLRSDQLGEHVAGVIWRSGVRTDARTAMRGGSLELGPDDYGVLTLGTSAIFFQQVRVADRPKGGLGWSAANVMSFLLSVALHVAVLLMLFIARKEMDASDPLELPADLIRRFMVTPPPEDILREAQASGTNTRDPGLQDREEAGGTAAPEPEGRVGRREAPQEQTEMQGEINGGAAARVRRMGLLGVLADPHADDSPLAALSEGPSVSDILGGLGSARTVFGRGSGGTGLRGEGGGGGGTGPGTLFGGRGVGTGVGIGGGSGGGRGRGGAGAPGRPREETRVALETGTPRVSGYLSPEQIMRVVRQNQAAVRYCYETELQRQPNLRGRIEVAWRINREGAVTTSRVGRTTMNNARVEGCIVRQVRGWRFPQPDGGEVDVDFPFIFGSGG